MNKPELDEFLDYVYKCQPEMRDKYFQSEFGMNAKEFWDSGIIDAVEEEEEIEEVPPYNPWERDFDGFDKATWDFFGTLKAREQIYKEQNTARN